MNPLLLTDYYKTEHNRMYPQGTTLIYSNFTPRKSRIKGIDSVVFFGLQHFILRYLIKEFNNNFFNKSWEELDSEYKRHINVNTDHIKKLYDLKYLPIEIKAIEEGTLVPIGVPVLTIKNTHPDFGWLTNYLETLISVMMWQPITSATIAYEYKKLLNKYALETTGSTEGVQWQAHDFSMRGMSSIESAILSGMAHLTSFTGTDVIPAIYQLEDSYNAKGLIGASVPATEHSVMCMGTKDDEIETFSELLDKYPSGILSVVSDTWDLWKVCTEYLPKLKEQILARDGKLVIRPDSGDPVDIICGYPNTIDDEICDEDFKNNGFIFNNEFYKVDRDAVDTQYEEYGNEQTTLWEIGYDEFIEEQRPIQSKDKGVIELLWDVFGGTTNEQGYKVLDSHIGAIYGDSITLDRAKEICERLKAKGFASTNIVFGVGSFTYQYNTRDTFGFAMKATYGEVDTTKSWQKIANHDSVGSTVVKPIIECREIFKDPITDDGTKKSKKGLLCVDWSGDTDKLTGNSTLACYDQQTWEDEKQGELVTVFKDGKLIRETSLEEIRNKLS